MTGSPYALVALNAQSPRATSKTTHTHVTSSPYALVACTPVVLRASQVNEVDLARVLPLLHPTLHLQQQDAVTSTAVLIQLCGRHRPGQMASTLAEFAFTCVGYLVSSKCHLCAQTM